MTDDVFGDAPDAERVPRVKVVWPLRPVNVIEGELRGRMIEDMQLEEYRAPMIFIEDDEWKNAGDYADLYGELTLHEAIAMQSIVYGDVLERYRLPLIIARECGESATRADYVAACAAENVNPLL